MPFSVRIIESDKKIEQMISNAIKKELQKAMSKAIDPIRRRLRFIVTEAIKESPEYTSLSGGQLKFEFGLPDGMSRINTIIDIWISNIQVEARPIRKVGGSFAGGITINMFKSDYSDVLASKAALFITNKGSLLNWLQWLLKEGDKTIIKDFSVELGPDRNSRTGGAVMVKGGRWRVPSQFSGTPKNNFLTRAMAGKEKEIEQMIERQIKRRL